MKYVKKNDRCIYIIQPLGIQCKHPKKKKDYCHIHSKPKKFSNLHLYHKFSGKFELVFD